MIGGEEVHPSRLLMHTGEMIRDMCRIDPDTGGFGWDGRIVTVSYDHEQEAATVALDTETSNFEALASRYAMFSGQG